MAGVVQARLEHERLQQLETEQAFEVDAFCVKLVMLMFLIASVSMLMISYRLEHGEVVAPLQTQFDSVARQVQVVIEHA